MKIAEQVRSKEAEPLPMNGLIIQNIHPKLGEKYSPNLYAWLTKKNNTHRAWNSRVYQDKEGTFWIGFNDGNVFMCGSRLMGVLCNGAKEGTGAYSNMQSMTEITDFWERYMDIGRCAIDIDHKMYFINDDNRWKVEGDQRECQWCGNCTQTKHVHEEVKVIERWVNKKEITRVHKM